MDLVTNMTLSLILGLTVANAVMLLFIFLTRRDAEQDHSSDTKKMSARVNSILSETIRESHKIIREVQVQSADMISAEKRESQRFLTQYHSQMKELVSSLQEEMLTSRSQAEESYSSYMQAIERSISAQMERSEKAMEEKTAKFIADTQTVMQTFLKNVEGKVGSQIDAEMAQVKKEIETYKEHRMKMVDDHIIEILERILQVTLGRKMSLSDQSSLIYEALETAKKEHALG